MYSTIPSAQTILLSCIKHGITDVVISPGSRNMPLSVGFASNKKFKCFSIIDERSAGFFALGIAQQSKTPVILLCTSGTALLNYSPAIAEAYYSDIPLIILSADRPAYKINIGDSQTIDQNKIFGNNILCSHSLRQDITHQTETILKSNRQNIIKKPLNKKSIKNLQTQTQSFNEELIHASFLKSIHLKKPIHINVPLEEPLFNFVNNPSVKLSKAPFSFVLEKEQIKIEDYTKMFTKYSRILILIGCSSPDYLSLKSIQKLSEIPGIVVLTESTSNLNHNSFYGNIDQIIAPIESLKNKNFIFNSLKPQLLVTLGGMIVSKKIKHFLREYQPQHHLHIGFGSANDTYFKNVIHLKIDPNFFFKKALINLPKNLTYNKSWRELANKRLIPHKNFINQARFTDLVVFSILSSSIPANYLIQVANSSPIRYLQLFKMSHPNPVYCNRGTSGIDGSTSTAIGASIASNTPTLLITGDLSFFYDANGLWNNYIHSSFRIILINNSGGGIFRILPGHKENVIFSKFIETQHNLTAKHLAKMHGFNYQNKKTKLGLKVALQNFFKKSNSPKVLEITTSSKLSSEALKNYFKHLSNA